MSEFVSNPLFGLALSIPSLSSGNADLQTLSSSIDNALAFVSCFYYHLSKSDGHFLPRLLPRWGLSEQLDCPINRGSRDSAL